MTFSPSARVLPLPADRAALRRQSLAQGGEHVPAERERAIAPVVARDHHPGRFGGGGAPQESFAHRHEPLVRHLGFLVRLGEVSLLVLSRDVQPIFEKQHVLIGEHLLEARDLVDLVREGIVAGHALHAAQDRAGMPGAEEDGDRSARRQHAPVAPLFGSLALLLRRLAERVGGDEARVEPLVEQVHRFAAAGALHAGDQHDDREAAFLPQRVLRIEERLAKLRLLALVGFLGEHMGKQRRLEHRRIME